MKPCVACVNQYGKQLCAGLGHCVFEGSGEWPTGVKEPAAQAPGLLSTLMVKS